MNEGEAKNKQTRKIGDTLQKSPNWHLTEAEKKNAISTSYLNYSIDNRQKGDVKRYNKSSITNTSNNVTGDHHQIQAVFFKIS